MGEEGKKRTRACGGESPHVR